MDKKKIAQLIIARLNGDEIERRYRYYQSLVKKGIGGFIVFGGRVREIRDGVKRLQAEAEYPLFIASDLEQGLGQQLQGGTFFPPAMAIASAINRKRKDDIDLLRSAIDIIALEAKVAGINIILAPVADVNTNPENPIICTRSFSDNPRDVAWFVSEFVRGIQRHGLIACAKHFPGHGDTSVDSHIEPPIVKADIKRLQDVELYPFSRAIRAGLRMVMIGHLKIPTIDPGFLATFSKKTIKGLLRGRMGFKGLVITDAMNMKAITKSGNGQKEGCLMALKAGADIILHPDSPERVIDFLYERRDMIISEIETSIKRILKAKKLLKMAYPDIKFIGKRSNLKIAQILVKRSLKILKVEGSLLAKAGALLSEEGFIVLIIDDDNGGLERTFNIAIRRYFKKFRTIYVDNQYRGSLKPLLHSMAGLPLIIAVYSRISAYKGRVGLSRKLGYFLKRAVEIARFSVIVGFCCPYTLKDVKTDLIIEAYSDLDMTQEYAAELLYKLT